jgi:hypothetical protein
MSVLKARIPPNRHPALNAGSVVDERGKRKAYNDLVLMKSARVITFPRQEIPHRGAG